MSSLLTIPFELIRILLPVKLPGFQNTLIVNLIAFILYACVVLIEPSPDAQSHSYPPISTVSTQESQEDANCFIPLIAA